MNGSGQGSGAPFLRKQAWDYFSTHASQRISVFNFYIALSSVTATTYAASCKTDSNLQPARGLLALMLCLFAFIFWKLDQRNRLLIKNAERALRHFEEADQGEAITKVFSAEEHETNARRSQLTGLRRMQVWRWTLSYSACFNSVFAAFALLGFAGLVVEVFHHAHIAQFSRAVRWLV